MFNNNLNWITLIVTVIFWILLFLSIPYNKVKNEQKEKVEWSIYKNDKNYMFDPDNMNRYMEDSKRMISLDYFGISILIYGFTVFILIFANKSGLVHFKSYLFIVLNTLFALFAAGIYYSTTRSLYFKDTFSYKFYFWIFGILPIIVLLYQILRIIFKRITRKEPIFIVGDIALFNDPINWLFRTSIMILGAILGIQFDFIEKIDKLMMHLA